MVLVEYGEGLHTLAPGATRAVFLAYILYGLLLAAAIAWRVDETHDESKRTALRVATLATGAREVLSFAEVRAAVVAFALSMGTRFATLSSIQPIFDKSFGRAGSFPLWFGLIALAVFVSSFANGLLVTRFGLQNTLRFVFATQAAFSTAVATVFLFSLVPAFATFPLYILWTISLFFVYGFANGNLQALALEHLCHVAGVAATIFSASGMLLGSLIAIPIGLAFDGTPRPLMVSVACLVATAYVILRKLRRT